MVSRKMFHPLIGAALAAIIILCACNTAATVAPAPFLTASALPVLPIATEPPVATVAPTVTTTETPTATPTATLPPVAQVIPSVTAYCRSGPGSNYNQITTVKAGTAYNVIGRNDSNTWWLVELYGGAVKCWTGAPGASLVGPVEQAPVVLAQPVLPAPGMFNYTYFCKTGGNTTSMDVTLTWEAVAGATGYHLYRNGTSLAEVGAGTTMYTDYNAPTKTSLVYELQALNAVGSTAPVYVSVLPCGG